MAATVRSALPLLPEPGYSAKQSLECVHFLQRRGESKCTSPAGSAIPLCSVCRREPAIPAAITFHPHPISQQWTALSNEANTIQRMGCILRLGMWQPCRLSFQLSLFRQLPVCVRTWCLSIICLNWISLSLPQYSPVY